MAKRIARLSGLSATRLLMGKLTEREQEKVAEATSTLKQFPFYLNETGKVTLHTLSSMARQVKGLHCVFIDYIGLLSISSGRWKTRYEEMTALSGALKQLARSLEVPVVCLSQLNRAGEGRAEKKPSLSDLRDSGALEQDADGVLLLWRPAATGVNPEPLELMVAKNRHAATGAVTLRFSGKTSKIAI